MTWYFVNVLIQEFNLHNFTILLIVNATIQKCLQVQCLYMVIKCMYWTKSVGLANNTSVQCPETYWIISICCSWTVESNADEESPFVLHSLLKIIFKVTFEKCLWLIACLKKIARVTLILITQYEKIMSF